MTSKSLTTLAVWILDFRFWKRKGRGGKRRLKFGWLDVGFASSISGRKGFHRIPAIMVSCSWWSQHGLKPLYEKWELFFQACPIHQNIQGSSNISPKTPYVLTYDSKNEAATYRVYQVRIFTHCSRNLWKNPLESLDQNIQPWTCVKTDSNMQIHLFFP